MSVPEEARRLALLGDRDRWRVVLLLGSTPAGVDLAGVADALGVSPPAALRALRRLRGAGLVSSESGIWQLREDEVMASARALGQATARGPEDVGTDDPVVAPVLRAFFRDGRLLRLPVQRSKRLVVLDHVARLFEPGQRYPEKEVDATLRALHDDYAAVRRALVDEDFLGRSGGVYWRTGGTVTDPGPE